MRELPDVGLVGLAPRFDPKRAATADGDIQVQPVLDSP
jgi:hypothetical protein